MLGVRAAAHPTIARIVGVLSPLESPTKVPRWFCVSRFSFAQPAFLCFSAGCSKDPAVACGQEKGLLSIATSHRSLCFTHVCSAHFAVPPSFPFFTRFVAQSANAVVLRDTLEDRSSQDSHISYGELVDIIKDCTGSKTDAEAGAQSRSAHTSLTHHTTKNKNLRKKQRIDQRHYRVSIISKLVLVAPNVNPAHHRRRRRFARRCATRA